MIIQSDYSPPAWLKNCHLQTVVGTWINRSLTIPVLRQRVELADDDFLEIDWIKHPTNDSQPTLLLLHGLEGYQLFTQIGVGMNHSIKQHLTLQTTYLALFGQSCTPLWG